MGSQYQFQFITFYAFICWANNPQTLEKLKEKICEAAVPSIKERIFLPIIIVQGNVYSSAQGSPSFCTSLCLFTSGRFHLWYFYLSDELKKIVGLIYLDKGAQWWNRQMFHVIQNSNENLYFQNYSIHYEKKKNGFLHLKFSLKIYSDSI